jgi:hypothetical protein
VKRQRPSDRLLLLVSTLCLGGGQTPLVSWSATCFVISRERPRKKIQFQQTDSVQGIRQATRTSRGLSHSAYPRILLAANILHKYSVLFEKRHKACFLLMRKLKRRNRNSA